MAAPSKRETNPGLVPGADGSDPLLTVPEVLATCAAQRRPECLGKARLVVAAEKGPDFHRLARGTQPDSLGAFVLVTLQHQAHGLRFEPEQPPVAGCVRRADFVLVLPRGDLLAGLASSGMPHAQSRLDAGSHGERPH